MLVKWKYIGFSISEFDNSEIIKYSVHVSYETRTPQKMKNQIFLVFQVVSLNDNTWKVMVCFTQLVCHNAVCLMFIRGVIVFQVLSLNGNTWKFMIYFTLLVCHNAVCFIFSHSQSLCFSSYYQIVT